MWWKFKFCNNWPLWLNLYIIQCGKANFGQMVFFKYKLFRKIFIKLDTNDKYKIAQALFWAIKGLIIQKGLWARACSKCSMTILENTYNLGFKQLSVFKIKIDTYTLICFLMIAHLKVSDFVLNQFQQAVLEPVCWNQATNFHSFSKFYEKLSKYC